jgi:hypothetical protein
VELTRYRNFGRKTASGRRQLYYRTQEICPKKKDSSGEFDALPLKRASDFEEDAASLSDALIRSPRFSSTRNSTEEVSKEQEW